ncbi:uncharacterized protein LOC143807465 [Ranitomeya variabilis]|uniref:uncharacterized protein LOC143807465 n=1 Tax=Ranitomeya variabilis TaxID=490064 RepID=UPI004056CCA8
MQRPQTKAPDKSEMSQHIIKPETMEMTDPAESRTVGSEAAGCSNHREGTFQCLGPGVTDGRRRKPRECRELADAHCSFKREEPSSQPDNEQMCDEVTKRTGSRVEQKKMPGIAENVCGKRIRKSRSCDNSNKQTPFFPRRSLRSARNREVACSNSAPCNRLSAPTATDEACVKHNTMAVQDSRRQSRKSAENTAGNTAICAEKSHCAQKKSLITYPGKRRCTCDSASDQTSGSITRSVVPWEEACTLHACGSGSQPGCKKIRTVGGKGRRICTVHGLVRGPCGTDQHDTSRQCKTTHMLQRMRLKSCKKYLKNKRKGFLVKVSWKLQECNRCKKKMTIAMIKTRYRRSAEACKWSVRSCSGGQSKTCTKCKKTIQDRRPASGKKAYSCAECGKRFLQPALLDLHQKSHAEEKLFVCPLCGKRFVQHSLLLLHQKAHKVNKPYQCMDCGNLFFSKSLFAEHVRSHKEQKPFRCSDCGKCFADNTTLVIHQRIHTGEKPFSCQKCGRSFTQPSTLVSHERIHSGEKPYECHVCGKRFRDRSSAASHQRIHNGEKPYKCSECGKRFTQSSNMRRHERLHTGRKPFICGKCGKAFNESAKLRSHENAHLNKERKQAQKTK